MEIQKNLVTSSNIEAIGYSSDYQILRVWFLNGSVYDYLNVPEVEYESLKTAPSFGIYLNKNIKGTYSYSKVG